MPPSLTAPGGSADVGRPASREHEDESLTHEGERGGKVSYWSLPHKPQLAVLMLARLAEPLAASSIQSYLYFQLQHFNPDASPATIASQVGLLVGAKTAAHVCTGMFWGRLADSEYGGRKFVLVFGLLASSVAFLGYGFATSFAAAMLWQVVEGALNGTVPMVRCVTAELNPQKRYRARALTLLPLCVNAGHLLGPLIGGFLVPPKGDTVSSNPFVAKFPYATPNIVVAGIHVAIALGVMFLLDETLDLAKARSLRQQRAGSPWWAWFGGSPAKGKQSSAGAGEESEPLLNDPSDTASSSSSSEAPKAMPFRQMWTFNVVSTMLTYFIIAGHMGTFPTLWAIFLSTPTETDKLVRPDPDPDSLRFYGGLGMDPRGVGTAMSLQGVLGVLLQVILYPMFNDRYGTIRLWRAGLFIFPIAYFLAPFCALVGMYARDRSSTATQDAPGEIAVWTAVLFVLLLFMVGRTGVAPATSLLINDCTPHASVRGTIHTTGTIVSSLSKTIFPPMAMAIFGHGLRIGFVGLGFWFIAALAALAWAASLWVVEGNNAGTEEEAPPKVTPV